MGNHFVDRVLSSGADTALFLVEPRGTSLTYADMRQRVVAVAGALVDLGVRPNDRVAAQIEKSVDGLILYLGVLYAGGIFLPLNIAYTSEEIAYFLGDAEPIVTVCDPSRLEAVTAVASCLVLTLDAQGRGSLLDRAALHVLPQSVERSGEDLAAILYTSGTTGRAKGAMLTHGNLVSNAETLAELWRFSGTDRLLHALPIYHLHGLFTAVNTVLVAGASLIFLQKFDVAEVMKVLPHASAMMGVPTFYTRLLAHDAFSSDVTRAIRLFTSGSAPLLEVTHRSFVERTGHSILERYGMTETNMTTSNPYTGERRPGTVGFALPGVEIRIVTSAEAPHQDNEVGMIEVRGPNVFKGYWRDPDRTAADFTPDGYFITGDLGRIDADGYLHISGRGKDLVISGGLNVYPKEVELALDGLPGVAESAVIGLPHPDLGEAVTAVVVSNGRVLDEASIMVALETKLARFKRPKRVIIMDELPRNVMGKVQKNILRERLCRFYQGE